MEKYTIGLDFGSLSARALIVNVRNGEEVAAAEMDYAHGILENALPCGIRLPRDYALQYPGDYLDALKKIVPAAMEQAKIAPESVIGIGVDATSSTMLPVLPDGTPLCFLPEFREEKHAYAKLWKHHAAQPYADRMTQAAEREEWLQAYGGRISAEWALPKFWQFFREAPQACERSAHFMEAGDWLVWQLTGRAVANESTMGYKALYRKGRGFPGNRYFAALENGLDRAFREKIMLPLLPLGARAGFLTDEMAQALGLCPGTAVAVSAIDGQASVPAVGVMKEGTMLDIIGTSAGHFLVDQKMMPVPGICCAVQDGVLPGLVGYEAGQNAVGDHFAWLVKKLCPTGYEKEAKEKGLGLHGYLTEKAARLRPGESGLIALDWWNGNRSTLMDADLSGLMIGMTLKTTCEEIYRALIEATAYGTRMIVENYRRHGVPVDGFIAGGGIAQKNEMMMQIYADVLNMPVRIVKSRYGSALGSAIFGAAAAGKAAGGWEDVRAAAEAMGGVSERVYMPRIENAEVYDRLYREYEGLYDLFGRGGNDAMKKLKRIRQEVLGERE